MERKPCRSESRSLKAIRMHIEKAVKGSAAPRGRDSRGVTPIPLPAFARCAPSSELAGL